MRVIATLQYVRKTAKKKEWNPNPWAVCNVSVGTEKTPKRERCIRHVKDKQKSKGKKNSMIDPIPRSLPYH